MNNANRLALAFFVFTGLALLGYFYITFGPIAIAGAVVFGALEVLAIKNVK